MLASMVLAVLPDVDVLFMRLIPYHHWLGHRGLTHSLLFAAGVGLIAAAWFRRAGWATAWRWWWLAALFAFIAASHGFFDAMTDGGLGVAFFAPFDETRYFFPWQPIPVSPLRAAALLTPRGLRVLGWEVGLFGPFAVAAGLWDGKRLWRSVAAGICTVAGLAMWAVAWRSQS